MGTGWYMAYLALFGLIWPYLVQLWPYLALFSPIMALFDPIWPY